MRHIATPPLRIQKLTEDGKVKITKKTVLRTQSILERNNLMEVRFKNCWRSAGVTFVKIGPELRCVQKCKKSRDNILKFSFWTTKLTLKHHQNQTRSNIGEHIDATLGFLVVNEHKDDCKMEVNSREGTTSEQRPWWNRNI